MSSENNGKQILNWIIRHPKAASIIGVILLIIILCIFGGGNTESSKSESGNTEISGGGNTESSKSESGNTEISGRMDKESCNNGNNAMCKKLCRNGDAEACESVCDKSFFVDVEACKLACDNGNLTACTKACKKGDADACEKACSGDSEDSCKIVAEIACNNGDTQACQKSCHAGVTKSCKKLCDSGDTEACDDLRGYKKDNAPFGEDNAIAYYKKWCDKGKEDACNEAGRMLYKNKKYKQAFEFYEKGCSIYEKGCSAFDSSCGGASCSNLCGMYNNGEGVEKNSNKAFECYQKVCNAGNQFSGSACRIIAKIFDNKKDKANAFEYYKKGCENLDGEACWHYAWYYEAGSGVAQSNEKAKLFYQAACKYGYQRGCSSASYYN